MPRTRRYKRVAPKTKRIPTFISKPKPTTEEVIEKYYNEHVNKISRDIDKDYVNSVAHGDDKLAFEKLVKDKMSYTNKARGRKYTVNEAISSVMGSKELNPTWTARDIGEHNLVKKLESDKELRYRFLDTLPDEDKVVYKRRKKSDRRRKTEVKYLKGGIDVNKMHFEGTFNIFGTNASVYIYDNNTVIIIYKSPKGGTGEDFGIHDIAYWNYLIDNNFAVEKGKY